MRLMRSEFKLRPWNSLILEKKTIEWCLPWPFTRFYSKKMAQIMFLPLHVSCPTVSVVAYVVALSVCNIVPMSGGSHPGRFLKDLLSPRGMIYPQNWKYTIHYFYFILCTEIIFILSQLCILNLSSEKWIPIVKNGLASKFDIDLSQLSVDENQTEGWMRKKVLGGIK